VDRARSGIVGGRTRFLGGLVTISALAVLVAIPAGSALAKRMVGTNGADRIVGTKNADRINARGGNDRVKGRAGGDRLRGSRGKDRVKGARGKDRLSAGKGADRLNAVDDRKDRAVNGGPGNDVCAIDQADLPRLKDCEKAKVKNGGPGGGPGADELRVTSASGLTCDRSLPPLCSFEINGRGAGSETVGTVSGGGGVTLAPGYSLSISGDDWTAQGLYGCSADGYLKVTIGSKSVRVPITCTV
jgi:Ca2+-binding RTX toxin-like protein